MKKLIILFSLFLIAPVFMNAQEDDEEDPKKMVREVISVEVEKPKYVPPPVHTEPHGKKGKKKHVEEPIVDVPVDTGSNMMPAPVAELAKRAGNWTAVKNKKFTKTNISNTGSNITVTATFPYKPKELNPVNDLEGEISMEVLIECKEGKYRYTVHKMMHKAKKGESSGGDVFNDIPACGSMNLNSVTWKQIRSIALADANVVVQELKAKMTEAGTQPKKGEW